MSPLAANALSIALAASALAGGQQSRVQLYQPYVQDSGQIPMRTDPAYRQILPSIASLEVNGALTGNAVLIDPSGLYLAQRLAVPSSEMRVMFANGQSGHVKVVADDPSTQLVLLRSDYIPPDARVASMPSAEVDPGTPLLVVMNGGSVRARLESNNALGMLKPSTRVLPLTELRFETTTGSLGGALVFTMNGNFVGVLNGVLARKTSPVVGGVAARTQFFRGTPAGGGFGGAGGAGSAGLAATTDPNPRPGPGAMTVAYTPGLDAMRRVVDGFLSPNHEVLRPAIGVQVENGATGALVESVRPGSPAAAAGVRPSDEIIGLGNWRVTGSIDFAKVMLRMHPGDKIEIRLDRGGRQMSREAVVGQSTE